MNCVSGMIYTESGFIEGHICFEEGIVTEVCEGPAERSDLQGLILPAFTNAHTHIADYIVPVNLNLSLEELVAPPNGFKHRMLNEAPEAKLRQGIATMSEYMFKHGTTSFIDFREGSVPGAKLLSSAEWSQPTIMGKPSSFAGGRAVCLTESFRWLLDRLPFLIGIMIDLTELALSCKSTR